MERTTIYLDDKIKRYLLDISIEESRKRGKRASISEMIRESIVEYLKRKGKPVEEAESTINRMLSTKGSLGEDFKKRVREVQKGFKRWQIRSV